MENRCPRPGKGLFLARNWISQKATRFTESVIREMSRVAKSCGALNLAQGFPDYPADPRLKEAACGAVLRDLNQYAVTWGSPGLREALADKEARFTGHRPDPETEITVTCGSTEGMIASLLAVIDPGDEVVIFQPFYENYGPDVVLSGAVPRYVTLHPPDSDDRDWTFRPEELEAAFHARTKAVIVNTPHNPTGKVFTREELGLIADLCRKWDVLAVTDEIYEHILYEGEHVRMASLPGMRERTVTVNGASKTFAVTGWRVGWVVAPEPLTRAVRKVHDFLTVGAAAPLQEAVAEGLGFEDAFFRDLAESYRARRDRLLSGLREAGFSTHRARGAYYLVSRIPQDEGWEGSDFDYAVKLAREAGVASVPGSSFYVDSQRTGWIRFCYAKREETLEEGIRRLKAYRAARCAPAK